MASSFHYIRNKKTGLVSRVVAKPYMGENSDFVELTEEEFEAHREALRNSPPPVDLNLTATGAEENVDNSELGDGVDEGGEDSR